MRRRFWVFVATALTLLLVTQLRIGIGAVGVWPAVWAAVVLGLVNIFVRPVVRLLTLPLNILTLGLFGWVVSALLLWLVSSVVPGFYVNGFVPALVGAVILSMVAGVVGWIAR